MLVMEDGQNLWLAKAIPRDWLVQNCRISVKNAPTHFGTVSYEIVSNVASKQIVTTISIPSRNPAKEIWLRLRHPQYRPITGVKVNGKEWKDFDVDKQVVKLHGLTGEVKVEVKY